MIRLLKLICVVSLALVTVAEAKRFALVIGNGQYSDSQPMHRSPNLKNAKNDAVLVARTFRDLGFDTILVEDGDLQEMYSALEKMKTRARNASLGVVYYAGHGIEVDGKNYVIPVDARLASKSSVRSQTLPLYSILEDMASIGISAKMVILDCCRNNPFASGRGWSQSRSAANGGLAVIENMPESTLIMYSAGPGQTASDGVGVNSPFTEIFAKVVSQPNLSCFDAFFQVSDHVKQKTRSSQQPWVKFDGAADAFRKFTFKGTAPSAPAGMTDVVQVSQQDYQNMREELERLKLEMAEAQADGHTPVAQPSGEPAKNELQEAQESMSVFLRRWQSNQESNSAEAWASDFVDSPEYCYWEGSGTANKAFIIKDREKLIKKYPNRHSELLGKATAEWFDDYQKAILVVSLHYEYSGEKSTRGNVFITMGMKKFGSEWKIISFKEDVRRNAYKPSAQNHATPAVAEITKDGLNRFLKNWLSNTSGNSAEDWASDFAKRIDYCYKKDGPATRQYLSEDRRKLIKKYPSRSYKVQSANYENLSADRVELKVVYDYDYGRASGRCQVDMTLVLQDGKMVISKYTETIKRK